jgi:uncharacterized membrane protein
LRLFGTGALDTYFLPPVSLSTDQWATGVVHEFGSEEYRRLVPDDERLPGSRAAILVSVHKVGTVGIIVILDCFNRLITLHSFCSHAVIMNVVILCMCVCTDEAHHCLGFAVPIYTFERHRKQLLDAFEKREACEIEDPSSTQSLTHYWAMKNAASLDGLPSMRLGEIAAKERGVDPYALKPFVTRKTKKAEMLDKLRAEAKFTAGFIAGILVTITVSSLASHFHLYKAIVA